MLQLVFTPSSSLAPTSSSSTDVVLVILLLLLLLGGVAWFLMVKKSHGGSDWDAMEREKTQKAWKDIQSLLLQHGEMGRKLAIIEADKLFDTCLRRRGFPGTTCAERLKVAEYQHPALRAIWTPHKWRNQLVHEASFSLPDHQAREALTIYQSGLKTLKAL